MRSSGPTAEAPHSWVLLTLRITALEITVYESLREFRLIPGPFYRLRDLFVLPVTASVTLCGLDRAPC